jgi:hypothetical protein
LRSAGKIRSGQQANCPNREDDELKGQDRPDQ